METALWIALGYGLALVGKIIAMFWIDHRRSVEFERRHRSRHNQRREAQSMTHEPDIRATGRYIFEEINERGEREWISYPIDEGPLAGFWDTDTRFTYDGTQSDPGDEHKERV